VRQNSKKKFVTETSC